MKESDFFLNVGDKFRLNTTAGLKYSGIVLKKTSTGVYFRDKFSNHVFLNFGQISMLQSVSFP